MKLQDIIAFLESMAPPALQENYDNSGLITGDPDMEISGALICLDSTPEVLAEAKTKGCNLVVAHHPIIFSGLKKITGKNYVERTVIDAIRSEIAIYAIHTNLDHVAHGVNVKIAEKLGLSNLKVLQPKSGLLFKISVYVPLSHLESVQTAMFSEGAGHIGQYDQCSFYSQGTGTFRAGNQSNPYVGSIGELHKENEFRLEVVVNQWNKGAVVRAMIQSHPYEEVAYDIFAMQNESNNFGAGLIGELETHTESTQFLLKLKQAMKAGVVRYTRPHIESVKTIAVCGGSGSFLLENAVRAKADVLVTADFKYHQFFDADSRIIIADIGHYESEQFTMNLLNDWFSQKFPTFASHLTEVVTNPVHYL
jgi:dinuclear metal center YbgI/SA1388 family protein